MYAENVIARMGPGCVNMGVVSGGFSREAIGAVELAGMMSGLSVLEVDFAYAYYANDIGGQCALRDVVKNELWRLNDLQRWGAEVLVINKLAALAVFEAVSPGRCSACGGVGHVHGSECDMCHGVGLLPVSGRSRAAFLGVSKDQWPRVWKGRYDAVYAFLLGLNSRVRTVIALNSR
jgi:hypothetical protein